MRRALLLVVIAACGSASPPAAAPPVAVRPPPDTGVDAAVAGEDIEDVADVADAADPSDEAAEIDCHDLPADAFPPALGADAPERAWSSTIRSHVLVDDCEHDWEPELRQCLAVATPDACEDQFPSDLKQRLRAIGQLAAAIASARSKPATIGCKQAVAGHYGDHRWKDKLGGFEAPARKQMIADSRRLMLEACQRERWDDLTRACLTLGGSEVCLLTGGAGEPRWSYPADGSVKKLGIAECDRYGDAVAKLAACSKVTEETRTALVSGAATLRAKLASLPPRERALRAQGCRAAHATVSDIALDAGC